MAEIKPESVGIDAVKLLLQIMDQQIEFQKRMIEAQSQTIEQQQKAIKQLLLEAPSSFDS